MLNKDMAPTRTVKSKVTGPKGKGKSGTEGSLGSKNRTSKLKPKGKPPPPRQQKTKAAQGPAKKKKRVYTDKELGIPKLNTITPVGVEKPKGKKKGKVFVDDRVRSLYMIIFTMLTTAKGKHDDYPCNGQCGQRRSNRVENDKSEAHGGNKRSSEEGS